MFIIYRTNAAKNGAACCNASQIVKLKCICCSIFMFYSVLSWYIVSSNTTENLFCRVTKIVDLPSVSTCRATSFDCLRHIHLSLRQGTTYLSMTSKSYPLSYFEHNWNWGFSSTFIQKLCYNIFL